MRASEIVSTVMLVFIVEYLIIYILYHSKGKNISLKCYIFTSNMLFQMIS